MKGLSFRIDWEAVPEQFGVSGLPIKLVNGEFLQLSRVELPSGFQNQAHSHPNEQAGIVLAGVIEYVIEDKTILCHVGDCYLIPAGKPHSIKVLSEASACLLEFFSPPRAEYR
ncbi:hypothetical protein ANRL2_03615 [Anaerolineae bacterium]|nr:hypothetical protein ANRL2_03615 [Anaerolineae bacterium]